MALVVLVPPVHEFAHEAHGEVYLAVVLREVHGGGNHSALLVLVDIEIGVECDEASHIGHVVGYVPSGLVFAEDVGIVVAVGFIADIHVGFVAVGEEYVVEVHLCHLEEAVLFGHAVVHGPIVVAFGAGNLAPLGMVSVFGQFGAAHNGGFEVEDNDLVAGERDVFALHGIDGVGIGGTALDFGHYEGCAVSAGLVNEFLPFFHILVVDLDGDEVVVSFGDSLPVGGKAAACIVGMGERLGKSDVGLHLEYLEVVDVDGRRLFGDKVEDGVGFAAAEEELVGLPLGSDVEALVELFEDFPCGAHVVGFCSLNHERGVVLLVGTCLEFEHSDAVVVVEVEHRGVDVGIFVEAFLVEDGNHASSGISPSCAPSGLVGIFGVEVCPGIWWVGDGDVNAHGRVSERSLIHLGEVLGEDVYTFTVFKYPRCVGFG